MLQILGWYRKKISFLKDLVWVQYQMRPLDTICSPLISNAVIFDLEQYNCDIFSGPFNLFEPCPCLCVCVYSHSKCQNLYQVSYHYNEVKKFETKQKKKQRVKNKIMLFF